MIKWIKRKIFPAMHKEIASQQAIAPTSLPDHFVLPLLSHHNELLTSTVKVGQCVLKNQMLTAENDLTKPPLHAPTSGIIQAITDMPIVHATLSSAPCIVLQTDHQDQTLSLTPHDWKMLTAAALREKCHQAGIVGLGGAGFPTALKAPTDKIYSQQMIFSAGNTSENSYAKSIETLIINGVECEPYITADDRLMQEKAAEIITGALILQKMVGAQKVIIAIEENKQQALAQIKQAVSAAAMEVRVVPNGYPSGSEKQLIHFLSGVEISADHLPKIFGFSMFNVGTAKAVHNAIVLGQPLISRVVTLTGEGLAKPENREVRIGTPIEFLLPMIQGRIIQGGNLMGIPVANSAAPVTKTTNCLWVEAQPRQKQEQPCIRCGFCAQVCPVNLLPQQLYWFAQGKQFELAQENNLFDCIECGACAYVCPSDISLVDYYRTAKQEVRKIQLEQEQARIAKMRFEARKERLENSIERGLVAQPQSTSANPLEASDKKSAILATLAKIKQTRRGTLRVPRRDE